MEGAEVEFGAVDNFMEPSTKYSRKADSKGYFSITNIKGAGLNVSVWKDGYDRIHGQSSQSFGYGMGADSFRKEPPKKDKPAIFILRKKAEAQPLFMTDRDVLIPKDGTPVEISLKTGKPVALGQGDIRIECWTNDRTKNAENRFEWHCRFSVPGGGLVERKGKLEQQAPEEGYKPEVEIHMPVTAQLWCANFGNEYFLKLGSGIYARARLEMIAGGEHFVSITSYLNPKPGSRNLEYDPKMRVSEK